MPGDVQYTRLPYLGSSTAALVLALTPGYPCEMYATDIDTMLVYSPTRSRWLAPGSRFVLGRGGSINAPVASRTGQGGFTLPAALSVPAGLQKPGDIWLMQVLIQRTTATATATWGIHFGTGGTVADENVGANGMAAAANLQTRWELQLSAAASGRVMTTDWQAAGGAGAAPMRDVITGINLAAAMAFSIGMDAANAADTFQLLGYRFELSQLG